MNPSCQLIFNIIKNCHFFHTFMSLVLKLVWNWDPLSILKKVDACAWFEDWKHHHTLQQRLVTHRVATPSFISKQFLWQLAQAACALKATQAVLKLLIVCIVLDHTMCNIALVRAVLAQSHRHCLLWWEPWYSWLVMHLHGSFLVAIGLTKYFQVVQGV